MLTDAHCRAAKPKEQLYRLNDLRGLYLEVKPNGVKAWRYRFKLGGKGSWFALGDYPAVSLAEARDKCEEARKLVKQGINPVQHRQLERLKREEDSANTFETVAAEAKRTMSGIFELAVATLRADNDPVWPVRKALPANKTQHKTALTTAQIGKLLSDFDNHRCGYQVNFCIQLMWWTLARPSETAEAEWAEFDLDAALWTIPARRMKARREHVVPLPTQAIEMLRRLRAISGDRTHLFPGRDDRNRPMSVHSIRQALEDAFQHSMPLQQQEKLMRQLAADIDGLIGAMRQTSPGTTERFLLRLQGASLLKKLDKLGVACKINNDFQKIDQGDAVQREKSESSQRFLPDLSQSMTLAMLCAMLVLFNSAQVVEWSHCRRLLKEGKKGLALERRLAQLPPRSDELLTLSNDIFQFIQRNQ